ncbi:hypothetical protein HN695_00925 [Candidatus Woesearchaeota archaeon]|jgi:hypothetical protein|nr:hypothetical protein [Candidatus Woesearchaeota archaeon]MBT5272764.1 hypothetical protein [Candidatus Woesearchaeota archaeon]MBT6040376.1 hypothetical protein [Candidatus Woesearchaeota archaeon]MBT6336991.1 hypothetical protein [Candidatus Woesearchaeota archaeon]MBT7926877.1 hypothetical protein [Candidatus Woesearchaeota archaeon]
MKYHLILALTADVLLGLALINDSLHTRALLIVPVLVLFHASIVVFGVEFDNMNMRSWKEKEKRIIEETIAKFQN